MDFRGVRLFRKLVFASALVALTCAGALAQDKPAQDKPAQDKAVPATPSPTATPAPATPEAKAPPSATPPAQTPATPGGDKKAPATPPPASAPSKTPDPDQPPDGKPGNTEIEPNGSPGIPQNAQTESVKVPARAALMVTGQSSYDDAFKSIKASLATLKTAMDKAGLKPSGHPITIFSEPDDKGFKYQAAIPLAGKPEAKIDLGGGAKIAETPAGTAIKFQHRGAYEDIDSTYDVITAYLDAKGLEVKNPYIEEYLTDLTTPDDPNLQVDIYVFVK